MNFLKTAFSLFLLAAMCASQVEAQTYSYAPQQGTVLTNPSGSLTTITAAGNATAGWPINGASTLYVRVAGTFSVLTATAQVSEGATATATFTAVSVDGVPGARVATISAAGLYRVNVAGYKQFRVNVSALTGTNVTFTVSAGLGVKDVAVLPLTRATYSASATALVTAASATDFLTVKGSATTTVRVIHAECSGIGSTAATADILGIVRSTADTTGTSTNPAAVPHDSASPAATAVVSAYTANPGALGTAVGTAKSGKLGLPLAATGAAMQTLAWDFGVRPGEQEIVLRGVAQTFALNGNGATLAPGASLDCSVTFTEE